MHVSKLGSISGQPVQKPAVMAMMLAVQVRGPTRGPAGPGKMVLGFTQGGNQMQANRM